MASRTRYGIIGCGMMGQEHLRNIALLPDTEVAAIFEPDPAMATAAAAIAPDAARCASVEALVATPGLDCVLIASPNHRHLAQLELLALIRPLPVLVEKPLFIDAAELARLDRFIAHNPAPEWVAMEYRYMPPIAAFLEAAAGVTGASRCSACASTGSLSSTRSAAGTGSTARPAARLWRNAATSSI